MKQSVVFVIYSMNVGGVEKALLGVINNYITQGWDVHIAMLSISGGFLSYIPKSVTIHKISDFERVRPIIHNPLKPQIFRALKNGHPLQACRFTIYLLSQKYCHSTLLFYRYIFKNMAMLCEQTFDLAVAFAGPDSFIDYYVSKKINSKEKWGWIHFDVSKFGIDKSIIADSYKDYSCINVVSVQAKSIFDKTFPQFAHKTKYTPNIVDARMIECMSKEDIQLPQKICSKRRIILTVGRISKEKGQFMALQALNILVKKGFHDLQWWFVGDGTDMERCRNYVNEAHLDEYVAFWGVQANPYPYMAKCDVYVQPSMHEGFCITLSEAKLFGMPIVVTDFTGAREQLSEYTNYKQIVKYNKIQLADAINKVITQL